METIKILKAERDDVCGVAKLFDLYRQFYHQQSDIQLAEAFIKHKISEQQSIILIAIDQTEEKVGFCQIYPSYCSVIAAPIYVLYDLFTLPAKRKMGVAKALLIAAEQQAKSARVPRMDLTTAKSNFSAQSLYESLGWQRDEIFLTYNRYID